MLQRHIKDNKSIRSNSLSIDTDLTFKSLPDSSLIRIHDLVTLLLELSPTLLHPAPHNRFEEPAHSDAAQHDINHVRATFPHAEECLVTLLGTANWERRQCLRRLRRQHEGTPSSTYEIDPSESILSGVQPSRTDSASSSEDSDSYVSRTDEPFRGDLYHRESDSGGSGFVPHARALTTTSSAVSHFQFSLDETQSTAGTEPSKILAQPDLVASPDLHRYRLPLPPNPEKALSGASFLCPFCFHVLSNIKSELQWRSVICFLLENRLNCCFGTYAEPGNMSLTTWNHTCALTGTAYSQQGLTAVENCGGHMRESVTESNIAGFARLADKQNASQSL